MPGLVLGIQPEYRTGGGCALDPGDKRRDDTEELVTSVRDSPAGDERGALLAMRYADEAVIVTNPEVSSVRDSDRIIGMLDSKTVKAERGERIEKHTNHAI